MQRTDTRTSSLVSGLDRLGMHIGGGNARIPMCQRCHVQGTCCTVHSKVPSISRSVIAADLKI